LTDKNQVDQVVAGKEIVIQAAAVTTGAKDTISRPYIHVTDNAIMNSLLLRACFDHQVKHLVFFSCTVMYPSQMAPVKETDFDHQIIDKYFGIGWTKVYIEKMCEFFSRIGNTKYTVIRHSNIYGPHDKYDLERSHVFGATVTKVMTAQNNKVIVWGDGSEGRDLLYISDLVDFVEAAIHSQTTPYELINVGYGSFVSIKNLVAQIILHSGRALEIEFDMTQPTIPFTLAVNTDKAKAIYGWRPKVSLDEGIKKTLAWYRKHILLEGET